MVEISLSGSGEGLRAETPWGYSTVVVPAHWSWGDQLAAKSLMETLHLVQA